MKKRGFLLAISFAFVILFATTVLADGDTLVNLNNDEITVNGESITSNTSKNVYLSNKMDNGGTTTDSSEANIEIDNIININQAGIYEFSGNLANGQISVNANNIVGDVNIVLNNVNITCNDAPAIFVYSKNVENENCKVTITLKENSTNTIIGGKIKQSVEEWNDQDSILYYIEKGYDDDRQYYERYKYDAAISSDISLTFEGEGTLTVNSSKKEGIESKMNITINGGTYYINSADDGINAATEGKSAITINNGKVVVNVSSSAEEGDGIDSNGTITINGGIVYAFACPGSDNGLDSDMGIYINGGTVFATGSMYEEVKTSNNTKIVQINLEKQIETGESILIADENDEAIFAYKADRKIGTLVYSSANLNGETYSVYTGNNIEGTLDEDNIYKTITSFDLSKMTKQENSKTNGFPGGPGGRGEFGMDKNMERPDMKENIGNPTLTNTIILVLAVVSAVSVLANVVLVHKLHKEKKINKNEVC